MRVCVTTVRLDIVLDVHFAGLDDERDLLGGGREAVDGLVQVASADVELVGAAGGGEGGLQVLAVGYAEYEGLAHGVLAVHDDEELGVVELLLVALLVEAFGEHGRRVVVVGLVGHLVLADRYVLDGDGAPLDALLQRVYVAEYGQQALGRHFALERGSSRVLVVVLVDDGHVGRRRR